MKRSIRTLTTTALAASALGLSAQSASAYAISGGSYTATATSNHTFKFGGAYTASCPSASVTYSGTATGAASTTFTPSYSSCTFFGLPALISVSGSTTVTVTGDDGGVFHVRWHTSATITIDIPSAGCSVTISGTREFTAGTMRNYIGGATADLGFSGIPYTAAGCPFASGTDGSYDSNGDVTFPGITVS